MEFFKSGDTLAKAAVDGFWYLHIKSKDSLGNEKTTTTIPFLLDNTGPSVSLTMTQANSNSYSDDTWTDQDVTVTPALMGIVQGDLTTAVTSFKYSLDGGATWSEYAFVSGSIALTTDGVHSLIFKAVDWAGNETTQRRTVKINKSGLTLIPTLKKADNSPYTSGEWTKGSVAVSVYAAAGGGGIKELYSLDENTWLDYTNDELIPFDQEGMHKIWFKVTDYADKSLVAYLAVNIDLTKPSVDFGMNGKDASAQSASTTVTVTDVDSGVAAATLQYAWTTDPMAPVTDWTPFTSGDMLTKSGTDGEWYLHIQGQDEAGNTTDAVTHLFRLDNTAPTLSVSMTTTDNSTYVDDTWTNQDVTVSTTTTDTDSATSFKYSFDGVAWNAYTPALVLRDDGVHALSIKVVDSAGNETIERYTVKINKNGLSLIPALTKTDNSAYISGEWTNGSVTVSVQAAAGISGIADLAYSWDNAAWLTYTSGMPIAFDSEDMNKVWFKVSDYAGNHITAPLAINIDLTAPVVGFGTNGSDTWTQSALTSVTVSDSGDSGVAQSSLAYAWATDTTSAITDWTPFTNGDPLTKVGADGEWYLHIRGQDKAGNMVNAVSSRFRLDNTAPVITLLGDAIVNLTAGGTYTEAGATATDAGGSGISDVVTVTGTVNANFPGTYILRYNVRDVAGNVAAEIIRTIQVGVAPSSPSTSDITKPVIDLNGVQLDPANIDISKPSVTLDVVPKSGTAYVSIPASILTSFAGKNATFIIEIKTPYGGYRIPINLASLIPGLKEWLAI